MHSPTKPSDSRRKPVRALPSKEHPQPAELPPAMRELAASPVFPPLPALPEPPPALPAPASGQLN